MSAWLCETAIVSDTNVHRGVIHGEGIVLPTIFQISDIPRWGGFRVKRVRIATPIAVGLVLCASPAGARLIPTMLCAGLLGLGVITHRRA